MAAQSIAHKYVSIEGDLVERGSLTQFAFVSVRLLLFRFHTVHISTRKFLKGLGLLSVQITVTLLCGLMDELVSITF